MAFKQKAVANQTIVITGASSGIGLVTAKTAARRGAKVVLASRNQDALSRLCDEINSERSGAAVYHVCDVGVQQDVQVLSDYAVNTYGSYDTWINNAGVSIYGKLEEVTVDDQRQLFETNFWGVVYGSLTALKHLKGQGGTIINIGSCLSDTAMPLQGIYAASKHAVKGFSDSLRMEIEKERYPVYLSLIKPGAIDTPYPHHAKNYMSVEPTIPPPLYSPEVVADAVLYCAEHPRRDVTVGAGGKAISLAGRFIPGIADKLMEAFVFKQQQSKSPPRDREDNSLFKPSYGLCERGDQKGRTTFESSAYTNASLHPVMSMLAFGTGLALAGMLARSRQTGRMPEHRGGYSH